MIFDEGGFVRTLWYGRSRIWQKARKYRHFGGFKRNHLRLTDNEYVRDKTLRKLVVNNYIVFYRATDSEIQVIRVIYGMRNFTDIL